MSNETVMYDSGEAATYRTDIKGWVSRDGRFYGADEHLARWAGSTHKNCDCGRGLVERHYTVCRQCRDEEDEKRYQAMPFETWDKEQPVCTYRGDDYFFSEQEFLDWCDSNEVDPSKVQLVICVPNIMDPIEPDEHYHDDSPDDQYVRDIAPKEIIDLFDALNAKIRELKPVLSWYGGKVRTCYTPNAAIDAQQGEPATP